MKWDAVIPVKAPSLSKSRLAGRMTAKQRRQLSELFLAHVMAALRCCDAVEEIQILSEGRSRMCEGWIRDHGRGLNAELAAARQQLMPRPLIVLHSDLPLLQSNDIAALAGAAGSAGIAIAPDRHGTGTNAIALKSDLPFEFCFGDGSFAAHCRQGIPTESIVEREGLAIDVDTPLDLAVAHDFGFEFPPLFGRGRAPPEPVERGS